MFKNLFLKTTLLALMVGILATAATATPPRRLSYFNYPGLRPVSEVQRGQEAEFELIFSFIKWLDTSVTPRSHETMKYIILRDTTDVTMKVTVSVMNYEGTLSEETISIDPDDDTAYALRFSVMIPDQDTLVVVTGLDQSGFKEQTACYLVWNGDEMEPRRGNPRLFPGKPDYKKAHPLSPPQRVTSRPDWAGPQLSNEEATAQAHSRRDSASLAYMRELEKTPLTDSARERIKVGGIRWERRRGDSLFREPLYYDKLQDSNVRARIAAFDARTEHEVCYDLRDTADYRVATSLLGPGSPSSKPGFLIFTATKDQINELSSRGFGIMYLEHNPSLRPETPDSSAIPIEGSSPEGSRVVGWKQGYKD